MSKQFGAKPKKADIQKYEKSPNWDGSKFVNLVDTTMSITLRTLPKLLYKQFCDKKNREPSKPLKVIPFDKDKWNAAGNETKYIWYGHSVIVLKINNLNIAIDPMFGPDAAPIAPFAVKRFSRNTLEILDTLPELDLVLLSHDHYDHLDFDSITKLKTKVKAFYVALGVKRHLEAWGIDSERITEFDWWEKQTFQTIDITFTPSRHFSGRGLTDRAKSLWGGWVLKTEKENIWFSGDSGYGTHFKEIGKRLGPFGFGFMESGQYNDNWSQIHMTPEESVQAAKDAGVTNKIPVHWSGFALAQHTWTEPAERFVAASEKEESDYHLPRIGEMYSIKDTDRIKWWNEL
ncbi:MAG: L-ascorbate metabolism protein UlaG (beta-lactamase superfamily) [Flavobacterium sp.]|jgi:L-ascorbate metabolism protein UlaG (beta-lactamase superfamily)